MYLYLTLLKLYKQRWFVTFAKTVLMFGFLSFVELGLGFIAAAIALPR